MGRIVAIGIQNFSDIVLNNCFYVDKTRFIKDWWDSMDSVTLITRPRRFGKTLTMNMVESFFSIDYAKRSDLFEHYNVWQYEKYRNIQGTYPVISISFARIKETGYEETKAKIYEIIRNLYVKFAYICNSDIFLASDIAYYNKMLSGSMNEAEATSAIYQLSDYLYRYYKKKVIILLDEYDTPMQEAYLNGYWDKLSAFTRSMFNSTFKTNPALERGLMTGITRVSKESIFSDLNNLEVVTTTSDKYSDIFGFTEMEVFQALDEYGLSDNKKNVKRWYDGFIFGSCKDIYNPWSILNYLDKREYGTYWANTSANSLVGRLIRESNRDIKQKFEDLLNDKSIWCEIDEQIVYSQLYDNEDVIWSLLLASGYLKVETYVGYEDCQTDKAPQYELRITNYETRRMFDQMIKDWFAKERPDYNDFIKAMFIGDVDAMNEYMNRISLEIFSFFDTGNRMSGSQPERFYHGFVLGLLVELRDSYYITSNRESGFGRYDVMLEPKDKNSDCGIILEFKIFNKRREKDINDTANVALKQIYEKHYKEELVKKGVSENNIYCYGVAFQGKLVAISKEIEGI
jgi:hypothetical protein